MKAVVGFFEFFAPIYDYLHFSGSKKTLECLQQENIIDGKIVLDLAGGTGRLSQKLKNTAKEIVVVDASLKMLKECSGRGLKCIYGLAETIPFANEYFDTVIIVDAFHHIQQREAAIHEAKRVLRPNGMLFIEEVEPRSFFGFLLMCVEKIFLMKSRFYHRNDLKKKISEYFTDVKEKKLNNYFYVLIARK